MKSIFKQSKQSEFNISIFKTTDILLIHPISKTTTGLGTSDSPVVRLCLDTEDEKILSIISDLWKYSIEDVKHPQQNEWEGKSKLYWKLMGVKNNKEFMKDIKSISILKNKSEFLLMPTKNVGKGFDYMPDKDIKIEKEKDLVPSIRKAFELCE